jgi:hypothetical protein
MKNIRIALLFFLLLAFCPFGYAFSPKKELAFKSKFWDIEDFRFGGGVAYSLYLTNQMDYQITTNYGEFKELIPCYFGSINKVISDRWEMGLEYRNGHLLTLKSQNTQGSTCDYQDLQFNIDYSFNGNAGLTNGRFTVNGQIGLGAINFRSKYFTVNTKTKSIDKIFSSVGYSGEIKTSKDQAEKQNAIIGNFGLVLGMRVTNNINLFWQNTVNISTSNKMSGNLHKRSWIPPDGYFFTGIGLYINITQRKGRLGCPKF